MIRELATWLRAQPGGVAVGGGRAFIEEYDSFERILPRICAEQRLSVDELTFSDFIALVTDFVARLTIEPDRSEDDTVAKA